MLHVTPSGRLYAARLTFACDNPPCASVVRCDGREGFADDLPAGWLRTRDGRHACSRPCQMVLESVTPAAAPARASLHAAPASGRPPVVVVS